MAKASSDVPGRRMPDDRMEWLWARYDGRLISPGGAAAMLGVSRQRVHQLIEAGELRCYRSDEVEHRFGPFRMSGGTRWAYVPLADVQKVRDERRERA